MSKARYFEGPLATLTARLFWLLPEGAHEWLERVTGGWRVVVWTKAATNEATGLFEIDAYCWEYWPDNKPVRKRRG